MAPVATHIVPLTARQLTPIDPVPDPPVLRRRRGGVGMLPAPLEHVLPPIDVPIAHADMRGVTSLGPIHDVEDG